MEIRTKLCLRTDGTRLNSRLEKTIADYASLSVSLWILAFVTLCQQLPPVFSWRCCTCPTQSSHGPGIVGLFVAVYGDGTPRGSQRGANGIENGDSELLVNLTLSVV